MFLKHPKVPKAVLDSKSDTILIETDKIKDFASHASFKDVQHRFKPKDSTLGATVSELLDWVKPFSDKHVLRFHSMYSVFKDEQATGKFVSKLNAGIKKADYRQY